MKKGWKILLISCGICAGIGVVLSVTGAVLGGVQDLREYGRRGMQYLEHDNWWSQKYSELEEMDEELDYIDEEVSPEITEDMDGLDLEGISELDIELSYVELIMQRSDSNQIEVSTRNMDPQLLEDLSIYRDEDTLEICAQDTRLWKNIAKNNAGELIIHVPDNLEGISTSLGTGTLYMRDIRTGELDISIGTGTADIQGFEAGEVSASAGTGSISLQGSVNSDLDLECGIGTIEFQDSGKMTDYNYSVSCGMGSIQIGDDEFTKPAGNQNINNHAGKEMDIECGMGTVNIAFAKGE